MARALKVFRTSIGFHDAYVAAPSKKAALEAWGAGKDLFAIGAAEVVTDAALAEEPLRNPGKVIKRARGSVEEHLAAAPGRQAKGKSSEPAKRTKRATPRPSRAKLDAAEVALTEFREESQAKLDGVRDKIAELQRELDELQKSGQTREQKLAATVASAQERYEAALEKWRRES